MAMTKDDIIRMALEAGIDAKKDTLCRYEGWEEPMEKFANLVAAAEREACANVCDSYDVADDVCSSDTAEGISIAIRARDNNGL
jgi:hypothetical protein